MSTIYQLNERLGVPTARRVLDGVFLLALAGALAVCFVTGLGAAGVLAVAVGSFLLEYAVSAVFTRDTFRGIEGAPEPSPTLGSLVTDLATEMGVDAPHVVVDRSVDSVTMLGDGDRAVLVVGESLLDDLDAASLRGIVAHELAHLALGHFRRVPVRKPITHVVGFAALWVVALQHLPVPFALLGGVGYLAAGASRANTVDALLYVVASLGVVLVPMALSAYASRLEECQADDVAVAHSSALAFCTGLYHVGTARTAGADAVVGRTPMARRRTILERLTAVHPSVEYRIGRQGLTPEDVTDAASTA